MLNYIWTVFDWHITNNPHTFENIELSEKLLKLYMYDLK